MTVQLTPCRKHHTPPAVDARPAEPAQSTEPTAPAVPETTRGLLRRTCDQGMATAEYAVATLAAVAFAGLLLAVLTSEQVRTALTDLITGALG